MSCVLCRDVTLINHSKIIHAVYVLQQLPPTVTQHVDMLILHPMYIYIIEIHIYIYKYIYVYIYTKHLGLRGFDERIMCSKLFVILFNQNYPTIEHIPV